MTGDLAAPVTHRFAEFASTLTLDRVPDRALAAARLAVLDWFGVTLAGSREPLTDSLLDVAGSGSAATVVGRGGRTAGLADAALVNGAAAHALDFDDYLAEGLVHASAPLVAALLALGEHRHANGRQLLEAFVVGYETTAHLAVCMGPALIERGFHPTGVLTHLGVAAGASRLLGLDTARTRTALGVAATQAAGLLASFGTMSKPLHSGKAAADGLLAARLVAAGYTGASSVLDGERGLPRVLLEVSLDPTAGANLGQRWLVEDNAVKPYAACGAIHAAIDAAIALSDGFDAAATSKVVCEVSHVTIHAAGIPAPTTGLEGKFSTAYSVSSALLRGHLAPHQLTDEAVRSPVTQQLLRRVELVERFPRIDEAAVTVTTERQTRRVAVQWAKGSPGNPMSVDDVTAKLRETAEPVIGPRRAGQVVETVMALEELADVALLAELVA